jgi:hypothetical protein
MNTSIQVTSPEYDLNISGDLTFYVAGNTVKISCGGAKFETLMRESGKMTIEWNPQPNQPVELAPGPLSLIPAWDIERKIMIDQDRFIYTLKGEVYGKIAHDGNGVRPLNDAEKSILSSRKVPMVETAMTVSAVRLIRETTKEEKIALDREALNRAVVCQPTVAATTGCKCSNCSN